MGVRATHGDEDVYLYRTNASPEAARRLFLVYLERINELADGAEFYHLLSNSCTVNIVRYANLAGRVGPWDFRHLLNGLSDRYLYRGVLDDDPGVNVAGHIFVGSKAPWDEIAGSAPQFEADVPRPGAAPRG